MDRCVLLQATLLHGRHTGHFGMRIVQCVWNLSVYALNRLVNRLLTAADRVVNGDGLGPGARARTTVAGAGGSCGGSRGTTS